MTTVIFINRFFYPDHSATSQILSDVAFYLAKNNYDVKIITSRQLYDDSSFDLPVIENISSVSVTRVWATKFGRGRLFGRAIDYMTFYLSAFFIMIKLIKKGNYCVAKTDPPMISVLARVVCLMKSAKLITWNQDLFPEVGVELGIKIIDFTKPILLYLRNKSLMNAHMNVVIGQSMRDKLLSLGVKSNCISVIPNWSDGEDIYPVLSNENSLKKKWGLENKFVVGYSGNMGRAHDFTTILDIAEHLNVNENIVFMFIGAGAKKEWIEDEAKKRKLTNIFFKPYQPRDVLTLSLSVPDIHVISLMPKLEGLIVPSKYYGVAAAGRACLYIGDKKGEISTILATNNCGATIDIGDVQSGVDYILKMKSSYGECSQQGERARAIFLKKFDAKIAYSKWMKVLHK